MPTGAKTVEPVPETSAVALPEPPTSRAEYVCARRMAAIVRDEYVRDGVKVASSRETPFSGHAQLPPVGTWAIDDYAGVHGHEVSQLREFDPKDLIASEDTAAEGRMGDVERYAGWAREGRRAPPISVVETDKGRRAITDGHRRWHAAARAGTKVLAWFSPAGDHPDGLVDASTGKVMRVGLTFEMVVRQREREAASRVEEVDGRVVEIARLRSQREARAAQHLARAL